MPAKKNVLLIVVDQWRGLMLPKLGADYLKLPNIDGETTTALNYELAAAYEFAGNRPAALTHFMHVYGSNIDYRDVAERIQALKS